MNAWSKNWPLAAPISAEFARFNLHICCFIRLIALVKIMQTHSANVIELCAPFRATTISQALGLLTGRAGCNEIIIERFNAMNAALLGNGEMNPASRNRFLRFKYRHAAHVLEKIWSFAGDYFVGGKAPEPVACATLAAALNFDVVKNRNCPWFQADANQAYLLLNHVNKLRIDMQSYPDLFRDNQRSDFRNAAFVCMILNGLDLETVIQYWQEKPFYTDPRNVPVYAACVDKVWPTCQLSIENAQRARRLATLVTRDVSTVELPAFSKHT